MGRHPDPISGRPVGPRTRAQPDHRSPAGSGAPPPSRARRHPRDQVCPALRPRSAPLSPPAPVGAGATLVRPGPGRCLVRSTPVRPDGRSGTFRPRHLRACGRPAGSRRFQRGHGPPRTRLGGFTRLSTNPSGPGPRALPVGPPVRARELLPSVVRRFRPVPIPLAVFGVEASCETVWPRSTRTGLFPSTHGDFPKGRVGHAQAVHRMLENRWSTGSVGPAGAVRRPGWRRRGARRGPSGRPRRRLPPEPRPSWWCRGSPRQHRRRRRAAT